MLNSYSSGSPGRAARGYGHVHRSSLVEGASPHELVRLMLDGAVASIDAALALGPSERDARHRAVDRALAFVQELQGSLRDPDADELAGRLFALYGFVVTELLGFTTDADAGRLRAAHATLSPIAEAWTAIGPEAASAGAGTVRRAA